MSPTVRYVATGAVATVAIVVLATLVPRDSSGVGALPLAATASASAGTPPTAGPGPSASPVASAQPSASATALPEATPAGGPLVPGETNDSLAFSEPFHFVVPATDPTPTMRQWGTQGGLRIGSGCCWNSWFIDDLPVNVDVCDWTKGRLADVPATPQAVGEWLRSASGLKVADPIEIPVDGRTALRFDVQTSRSAVCRGSDAPSNSPSVTGFRYYAIPTGDDTILYVVWADPGSYPSVKAGADALVRSMTFDR